MSKKKVNGSINNVSGETETESRETETEEKMEKMEEEAIPYLRDMVTKPTSRLSQFDNSRLQFDPETTEGKTWKEMKKGNEQQRHIVYTKGGRLPDIYAYVKEHDGIPTDERSVNPERFVSNYTFDPHTYTMLEALNARVSLIEKSIGASHIIQATPIANLVSLDMASKNSIKVVYDKWISLMEYIANQLHGRRLDELFWAIDKNVFNNYFLEKSEFVFRFIGTPDEYANVDDRYTKKAWVYDRDPITNTHLHSQDKEYVHHHITDREIYIFYLLHEIREMSNSISNKDDEIKLWNMHSLIGGADSHSIPVTTSEIDNTQGTVGSLITSQDQRHRYLGGNRILFNTIVDTGVVKRLRNAIHKAEGDPVLMVCIILVHAMLHLKCSLTYGTDPTGPTRHTKKSFVEEVIRHVPPVLYGHPMLPLVTLNEQNVE